MYHDIEHYMIALAIVLPLTLFCYWIAYVFTRKAMGQSLGWPIHFAAMALAVLMAPFMVPLVANSVTAFESLASSESGLLKFFSVGLVPSVIAQVVMYYVQDRNEPTKKGRYILPVGPLLGGAKRIFLPEISGNTDQISPEALGNALKEDLGELSNGSGSEALMSEMHALRAERTGDISNPAEIAHTLQQLEKLKELKEDGALTDEDFDTLKARIISSTTDSS